MIEITIETKATTVTMAITGVTTEAIKAIMGIKMPTTTTTPIITKGILETVVVGAMPIIWVMVVGAIRVMGNRLIGVGQTGGKFY
jgi:hypothetical protein